MTDFLITLANGKPCRPPHKIVFESPYPSVASLAEALAKGGIVAGYRRSHDKSGEWREELALTSAGIAAIAPAMPKGPRAQRVEAAL